MVNDEIVRKNMTRLRKEHGYSTKQLAEFLKIDIKFYEEYERGDDPIPLFESQVAMACDLYGITIDMMYGADEIQPVKYQNYIEKMSGKELANIANMNKVALEIRDNQSVAERERDISTDFICDSILPHIPMLINAEFGILFLKREDVKDKDFVALGNKIVSEQKTLKQVENDRCCTYQLFPVFYNRKPNGITDAGLSDIRNDAYKMVSEKWRKKNI